MAEGEGGDELGLKVRGGMGKCHGRVQHRRIRGGIRQRRRRGRGTRDITLPPLPCMTIGISVPSPARGCRAGGRGGGGRGGRGRRKGEVLWLLLLPNASLLHFKLEKYGRHNFKTHRGILVIGIHIFLPTTPICSHRGRKAVAIHTSITVHTNVIATIVIHRHFHRILLATVCIGAVHHHVGGGGFTRAEGCRKGRGRDDRRRHAR